MTLDAIRLFVLAAKYHSITGAARESHITQSAASRQLKQLQHEAQIKLLKKTGRGVEPTDAGRIFLNEVSPICSQMEELKKRYSPSRDTITIAASYRPSKYLLPALMTEFYQKHPSAKLTILTRNSVAIEKLLLESKVDLAITTNATLSPTSFVSEPYCREPLMAFVAANHPLARIKPLRLAEMGTIPVIIKSRREGESRAEAQLGKLEKEGIKFKTVVRCDSPEVVKEFVRYGAGVGFLYLNSIQRGIDRGYFKTIQFPGLELVGQSNIVYSKDRPLSSLAREFLAFLRASVTKDLPVKTTVPQVLDKRSSGRVREPMFGPKLLSWIFSITSCEWSSWVLA